MQQRERHTDTEEAIEDETGTEASLPYALRADQLADGTYRYALEDTRNSKVIAEGVHAEDHKALDAFRRDLAAHSALTDAEKQAFQQALRRYDKTLPPL